jgi:hypothetical protein
VLYSASGKAFGSQHVSFFVLSSLSPPRNTFSSDGMTHFLASVRLVFEEMSMLIAYLGFPAVQQTVEVVPLILQSAPHVHQPSWPLWGFRSFRSRPWGDSWVVCGTEHIEPERFNVSKYTTQRGLSITNPVELSQLPLVPFHVGSRVLPLSRI